MNKTTVGVGEYAVYVIDEDGKVERGWPVDEALIMLREMLPFAAHDIESATYSLYCPEHGLNEGMQEVHALLRRAHEMTGVEPGVHSVLHWDRWLAKYREVTKGPGL